MKEFSTTLEQAIQDCATMYLTTDCGLEFARKRVRYEVTSRLRREELQSAYDRFDELIQTNTPTNNK